MDVLTDAYAPADLGLVSGLLAGLLGILLLGFGLMRLAGSRPLLARMSSWLLVCLGFASTSWLSPSEPPGVRMLLIIGAVLFSMKAVVAVEEVRSCGLQLSFSEWMAWSGLWPGMDPQLFSAASRRVVQPAEVLSAGTFFVRGAVRLLIGVVLLSGAHLAQRWTGSLLLSTVLVLPGISLILHFGIFNLICAFWRLRGVPVWPLFPAPLSAHTLGEFWGKRWNLPFTEMIQRAVYRPLSGVVGRRVAAMAGFGFSGLLHECAISVPVQRGYGLPLLYFLIHGGLVVFERGTGLRSVLPRHPVYARLWTILWLALPMALLFHPPFLRGIVWPLAGIAG